MLFSKKIEILVLGIYVASITFVFLEVCLFAVIRNINITVRFTMRALELR